MQRSNQERAAVPAGQGRDGGTGVGRFSPRPEVVEAMRGHALPPGRRIVVGSAARGDLAHVLTKDVKDQAPVQYSALVREHLRGE